MKTAQPQTGDQTNSTRKIARRAGVFFLLTEITAIGGLALYGPVLHNSHYIVGSGADTRVLLGALLELLLIVANIGTAVTLYPVVKRQNERLARSYVYGRVLEGAVILIGIISIVAVVTMRQNTAGVASSHSAHLISVGKSLIAVHKWSFLLGPNVVLGINSLMLAYLMYESGLVPRFIALLGLVGGPVIFASAFAVMLGLYQQTSTFGFAAGLPVFAWEVSIAVWMIAKGFKPSPITASSRPPLRADWTAAAA